MDIDETNAEQKQPENEVFFVPLKHIKNIEKVIDKLKITYQELQKIRDTMKIIKK